MIKSKADISTKAQPNEDMLTNKISMALNYEQIAQDFYVYKVTADSLKGENFKTVIANTYKLLSPLSLVKPASSRQYANQFFILCCTPQDERSPYPDFTIKQIQSIHQESQISQHDLARLLIQAIPSLKQINGLSTDEGDTEESNNSYNLPASGGIGLYYLQKLEKIHKKTIVRSFEIDIKPLSFDHNQTVVTIKGVTFTPRSLHKKSDGSYPANIARLPSFNVLPFLNHVKKVRPDPQNTLNEDYVKKAVKVGNKVKRMKSTMIDVNTSKPEDFFKSKIGVLAHFQKDVDSLLSPYMTLQWQSLPSSYRSYVSDKQIDSQYDDIYQVLSKQCVYVCDTESNNNDYVDAIIKYLASKGLDVRVEPHSLQEFDSDLGTINQPLYLIVHHDQDYYEANGKIDPYQKLKAATAEKSLIKQSLSIEKLFAGNNGQLNKNMLDNSLTELLVKLEIALGQLLLPNPPTNNWRLITASYEKQAFDDQVLHKEIVGYDVLDYKITDETPTRTKLSYQHYDALDDAAYDIEDMVSLIKQDNGFPNDSLNLAESDHLIICDPDANNQSLAYLIQETNCLPLPKISSIDTFMRQLYLTKNHGFEISWAEDYLRLIEDGSVVLNSKSAALKDKLTDLINTHSSCSKISYADFKKFKINYQSTDDKDFIDWVYENHKHLLNVSLRSKKDGYLDAATGIFYNTEDQTYFAGSTSNLNSDYSNFNIMRKVYTAGNKSEVPQDLLKLMDAYHIRHRQTTVLPFLFKHLREFVALNRF